MGLFLTDYNCISQRKYVNIPAWDKYNGNGISIFHDDAGDENHIKNCIDILHVILPKAIIYSGSIGYTEENGIIIECHIKCNETKEILPFNTFITKYNISLINNSTDGGESDVILPIAKYMKEKISQYNIIMTGAAGNGGDTTQKYYGACIEVTSCHLKNGTPVFSNMSTGENIDFSMFNGFQAGTSFSSPFLLGMIGKIKNKYPNITQEEIKQYLKINCKDILSTGFDIESGWGLPILPNPLKKYITMTIGNKNYYCDGNLLSMDTVPVLNNGNTFIPVRVISDSLGKTLTWNATNKTINITDGKTTVLLTINSTIYTINGIQHTTVTPYIDKNNRTMIPIRTVAEAFNCKVGWVQSEQKVLILEQ